ncbi:tetratricopeptide repeat protein [Azonexus sp.]|uniref:tetratricopeptide repeat protein n=1 Tax=Azonexus sp. TaxID=1872668 RepID=UPI0039E36D04
MRRLRPLLALAFAVALPVSAAPPVANEEDLLGRTVFQVLLGELALREGAVDLSLQAWADLAQRTREPKVIARAAEIAGYSGNNVLALQLVRRWQELEPDSPDARRTQVALLIQARELEALPGPLAAHLAAERAADATVFPGSLLHLNRMFARVPDKRAVFTLLANALEPHRDLPEAHFALAQAALAASDESGAQQFVQRALALRPDWEAAAVLHAKLLERNSPDEAIAFLKKFSKNQPQAQEARLALGQMLVTSKRLDEARPFYLQLAKDFPEQPAVLYPAALLALQDNDRATGQGLLEQLLALPHIDKNNIHYLLGQLAQEAGQADTALAHFRQVKEGERLVPARARSAIILLKQNKREEALALLHGTAGRTPAEKSQLFLTQAQLLREEGKEAEALETLRRGLQQLPEDADLLYDTALTAERQGQHAEMEKHLRHLIKLQPQHAHALNALGYSLVERNLRLDEAAELLQRATQLAPEDAFIMDSLGWLYYRQGKLPQALTTLQQAYRLKDDPEIAAHLGEVLWQMERRDEARQLWRSAVEKNPQNAALQSTLRKFQP